MHEPQPDPHPFHHRQPIQMRFNDLDALGHVNNTIYLEYMDFGKIQYIQHVLDGHFNFNTESLVIANLNVNFFHISLYGEHLEVLSRVDEITEHTVVFVQRIRNIDTGQIKVECRTIMVGFNIVKGEKMPIADNLRRLISEYEGRPL